MDDMKSSGRSKKLEAVMKKWNQKLARSLTPTSFTASARRAEDPENHAASTHLYYHRRTFLILH